MFNSRTNKAFRAYNEFLSLTFRNKEKVYNTQRIAYLGKFFGLNLGKSHSILNENFFKLKENAFPIKERMNYFLC